MQHQSFIISLPHYRHVGIFFVTGGFADKYVNIAGKIQETADAASYYVSNINADNLLLRSRNMPVIAGNNLHFGGAGKLPVKGFHKMVHL